MATVTASYATAKASVDAFNTSNRWRKQGISVMPVKYCIGWNGYNASAIIRIYPQDGHVEISTSACCGGLGGAYIHTRTHHTHHTHHTRTHTTHTTHAHHTHAVAAAEDVFRPALPCCTHPTSSNDAPLLASFCAGGVEIGQGLYTKVAQSVAYKLGIDLSLISVVPTSSDATPAITVTGGSGTSETSVMVRPHTTCPRVFSMDVPCCAHHSADTDTPGMGR